ncbi:DUF6711 family protein [Paenibacillus sp. TAF43_2]|uniref:DUF6711 family protein n=1 Tax=Paenibacillus sp. TAF43_2 TaxID=3233069 RepID=UPI003F9B45F7
MALLKINGVDLPTPSSVIWAIEPIDKADRNARGDLIKERINIKRKLELSWAYLPADDLARLLTAILANFISVTYLDPQLNAKRTASFYASPPSIEAIDYINDVIRYKNIKFNIIEK